MTDEERDKYPSELAERFQVRLPPGLRERIKRHADDNKRSMNSEIVHLIEAGLWEADMSLMESGREPLREMTALDRQIIEHGKQLVLSIEQQKQREAAGVKGRHIEPDDMLFLDGDDPKEKSVAAQVPITAELFDELFAKSKFAEEIEKLREELRVTNAAIARADKLLGEK